MRKFEFTQIGQFHDNHNEDFLISKEIGDDKFLIAVMDGCTMGTESHFASTLIGKILKKIALEVHYLDFVEKREKSTEQILKDIFEKLFNHLKILKNNLGLERDEVLSTIILGIVDISDKSAEIITIGDGLISCNWDLIEYEQDNKPDYLGYHLDKTFDTWFKDQNQRLSLSNIEDLSISTDGIFTFRNFDNNYFDSVSECKIIDYLLRDKSSFDSGNMFRSKLSTIEKNWGLKPTDDLSIIRLILD